MRDLSEIRPKIVIEEETANEIAGWIFIAGKYKASVVCNWDNEWEHVSMRPLKYSIIPDLNDICYLKNIFFNKDETVIQIYKNTCSMKNCLHLWRCAYQDVLLPPCFMAGVQI